MTSTSSSDPKRSDLLKRLFMLGCLGAFVGSLLAGLVPIYLGRSQSQQAAVETTEAGAADPQAELRQRERGYEIVLEREPNNPVALEGLAQTRMALGDAAGAIAPLAALVSAYPDRADYQEQLDRARQAATP